MEELPPIASPKPPAALVPTMVGAALLATAAGATLIYKTSGGLAALSKARQTTGMAAKARLIPLTGHPGWAAPMLDTANYFAWIAVALTLGLVIGALVKAALPSRWLFRAMAGRGPAGLAFGALIGAPLMLCSCCIAPVFDGAYARTRKLGPSLALMLAAPGLNPIDLAIVFALFPRSVAIARLVGSLVLVLGGGALLGRLFPSPLPAESCALDEAAPSWSGWGKNVLSSLVETAQRALPAVLLGALLSALIAHALPLPSLASGHGNATLIVLIAAALATPLALPTFGEIPLALALLAAGAPAGAAAAILIAGPMINLPSLLVLRRTVSWSAAAATATAVLLVACGSGLITNVI
ncbi:MAG: permease [Deltaproteobacteria bacterium]